MGSSLFARHYSGSRGFFPFLRVLRCFSSPACHSQPMYSAGNTRALPRVGFPIRRSRDQRLVSTSPALIAAAHVLHRLLAPRHPPCALVLLIEKNTLCAAMEFSRCTRTARPPREKPPDSGRSLKTQQRLFASRATLLRLHPNHRPYLRRLPPLRVRPPASGIADFRGVTGGVYKAREHIHRGVADPRLLATPPSWRRVSASNPNRDRLFGIRSPSRVCSPLYRPM